MRKQVLIAVVVTGVAASFAFARMQEPAPEETAQEEGSTVQPIAFPHNVHAGTYQMECMYCHFSADRSVDAGIPPVSSCLGCHLVIPGRESPQEVAKVAEYFNRGEPIPWTRIYSVADHVTFPHMRHVAAGVTCQTCHGEVQEMGVIESRAPEWKGDDMGWCVSCHVRMDASRDCTVCHY